MINWNTDEEQLKKNDPEGYKIWRVVQLINYGLDGEKLDITLLKTHWSEIKQKMSLKKRKTLEGLVWNNPWQNQSV